jgi:hypothetical protein
MFRYQIYYNLSKLSFISKFIDTFVKIQKETKNLKVQTRMVDVLKLITYIISNHGY